MSPLPPPADLLAPAMRTEIGFSPIRNPASPLQQGMQRAAAKAIASQLSGRRHCRRKVSNATNHAKQCVRSTAPALLRPQGTLACAGHPNTSAVCSSNRRAHLMALWQEAGLSMVTKP